MNLNPERTLDYLRRIGVNDAGILHARSSVEATIALVGGLNLSGHDAIYAHLRDATRMEHGLSTLMIASLMAVPLQYEAPRSMSLVCLAALLHDVGLRNDSPALAAEDQKAMTEDERKHFLNHPVVGAEILSRHTDIPSAVIQAVLQHHERRDRTGFPSAIGPNAISRTAEIVGMAEEFVRLIGAALESPTLNPVAEMEKHVFTSFSPAVVDAFKTILPLRRKETP